MVYIAENGRVLERRPWNLSRIVSIFTGLWFMAVTFFSTLFAPFMSNRSQNNDRRGGGGWGSGGGSGGGGGGGGGGGDGGNGRPFNRRIGRINTTSSMDCPSGGCCG